MKPDILAVEFHASTYTRGSNYAVQITRRLPRGTELTTSYSLGRRSRSLVRLQKALKAAGYTPEVDWEDYPFMVWRKG